MHDRVKSGKTGHRVKSDIRHQALVLFFLSFSPNGCNTRIPKKTVNSFPQLRKTNVIIIHTCDFSEPMTISIKISDSQICILGYKRTENNQSYSTFCDASFI